MSELTDGVLGRYLDTEPGLRARILRDPVEHARVESMRRYLDVTEGALSGEGVPEGVRRRVLNRIVWGDPEEPFTSHAERRARAMMAVGPSGEVFAEVFGEVAAGGS